MNEDERSNELPISEADTTPPNPANSAVPSPGAGWQMPEPKFQQTSGYLPEAYLGKIAFETPPPTDILPASAGPAAAAASANGPGPDIGPQPDLNEQLEPPPTPTITQPVIQERSAGARIALIVLGLLAMVAFIVVFLGVIYYFFLMPQADGSTF